jgi:ABC-type cobalt transport system substrate-binding protein
MILLVVVVVVVVVVVGLCACGYGGADDEGCTVRIVRVSETWYSTNITIS